MLLKKENHFKISVNSQAGTTYTLQDSDNGKVIKFTNNSDITVLLPNNLESNFVCNILQKGLGQVIFTPVFGAILRSENFHNRTSGQHAIVTISMTNSEYLLLGDTAKDSSSANIVIIAENTKIIEFSKNGIIANPDIPINEAAKHIFGALKVLLEKI